MKIDLGVINWDLVWAAVRWGTILAVGLGVFLFIKEAGRKDEVIVNLKDDKKVLEQKIEVKNEVHQVINRVVVDPKYRDLVRSRYDTSPK